MGGTRRLAVLVIVAAMVGITTTAVPAAPAAVPVALATPVPSAAAPVARVATTTPPTTTAAPSGPVSASSSEEQEHARRVEFVEAAAGYHPWTNYTNVPWGDKPAMTLDEWNTAWNVVVSAYLAAGDIVNSLAAEVEHLRRQWQTDRRTWYASAEYDQLSSAAWAWRDCTGNRPYLRGMREKWCKPEWDALVEIRSQVDSPGGLRHALHSSLQSYRGAFIRVGLPAAIRDHNRLMSVYEFVRCAGGKLAEEGTYPLTATYPRFVPAGDADEADVYAARRFIHNWGDSYGGGWEGAPVFVIAQGFKSVAC